MALEGIENVDYIDDLSGWATNPVDEDDPTEGAEHIRLTKKATYQSFPNVAGEVTPTHTELNYVDGVTSAIQDQLTALSANDIEATTVMCFYQAAAPTGWTGSDALANNMLRVVTETSTDGGKAAGTDSPILMNKVPSHTHAFTTAGGGGSHTHTVPSYSGGNAEGNYAAEAPATDGNITSSAPSGTHTHTGTSDANGSAANWVPLYASVILATKD